MIKFLLAWLFFHALLFANIDDANNIQTSTQKQEFGGEDVPYEENLDTLSKVIYLNYEKIPQRVLKGEIFSITIKNLCVVKNFVDITYKLSNETGLKILNPLPSRQKDSKYYYDTFYFIATSQNAKLPDFEATLIDTGEKAYKTTILSGEKLNVISLNPKSDFSNIIANSFDIIEYKTTSYDATHNIVVFVATAINSDISALKLNGVYKQGIESATHTGNDSKITYYAIVGKSMSNLSFSYFNVLKNRFIFVNIPLIVSDDSVTTQSDLKPTDQSNEMIKMGVAATVAFLAFLIILWRKRYIYLIFIFIPLGYILSIALPSKEVCVKEGSSIYLLPMNNGTIFEKAASQYNLQKEAEVNGWIKVQLNNKKIGWVKNEDICSH
ncbi:hypothetical protein Suden_0488 [Sulfurimonas denitrificans DSM 1251]|uniref:Periplasmic protein n=1 Tax=Sulfurimonas denitrificans (strain ATCC 33889 / DSM 1251) TaxID=326298 RepID=Q30TB3_SULDN|nr:hypothetical protein [Sulfurimonas denitrificans]ABB43768.1 hypothetical protein Suden_0488 [Sulfurimonas denitrificans DSM 1251]MDD3442439.1 hypothetical protein [Sulfurimonas denitrificans]